MVAVADPRSFPKVSRSPQDEHAFHELGSRRFEHLARALHAAEPDILGAILYGPDGQMQFGADHIAWHRTDGRPYLEVGQSKAERSFSPTDIREAADKFLDHWEDHWREKDVRRFILFVGCTLKSRKATDEVIAQTARFADLGIAFSLWDAAEIYDHLPAANVAVRTYLGQEWYESIFGKPTGPLTGLLHDLERGWDPKVLSLQAFVTRLNQAETAETAELKRRVRRGEGPSVVRELDLALRSEVADALADAVRAEKLRLLASLLIATSDFARVRRLLDEADTLDGDSARLRSVLLLESVGAEAAVEAVRADGTAEIAEVRTVALLRLGRADDAYAEIHEFAENPAAKAETLRLASLAKLAGGDRERAIALAERAIAREPENRACQQALAVAVFHHALSPAAPVRVGEWPEPVDQPLVQLSDRAREDLERAESLFSKLMADPTLDAHRSMVMWHFGVLACMPWRHAETAARLNELQATGTMPIPLIAWALSRALSFDHTVAAEHCDAVLAADPKDFETRLIRVALAMTDRDLPTARSILADGREALTAAGHAKIHDYWHAVIEMEAHHKPGAEALAAHPWLRLRAAMQIRRKKLRRPAIAEVLDDQLAHEGDPRVILAACQMLLEAGWHRAAVKAAPYLVSQLATAEALATAAQAYFRDDQPAEVLATLSHLEAFPGNKLPVELERLRALCLAATGEVIVARDLSLSIARSTKTPGDLWQSIQLHLVTGAMPEALALYEEHAAALAAPSPGHISLARAILRSNPEAATRITRHIVADAPDDYVTAAFDLANKLRLTGEQRILVGRMQKLGAEGKGGVKLVHIDDIMKMMREHSARLERSYEQYANGHAPVHVMAAQRQTELAATYLDPLLHPPKPSERRMLLSSRYGRRFDERRWPDDRADVRLLVDVTALLTVQGLGLLDVIERSFAPMWIAPDAVPAVLALRSDTEIAQPERIDAARRVLDWVDAQRVHDQADLPTTDTFHVLWEGDGGEPSATLSFHRLFDMIASLLTKTAERTARDRLGNTLEAAPVGAHPTPGAVLTLDHGIALMLEEAGLLAILADKFRVGLSKEEIASLRATLVDADRRQVIIDNLSVLIEKLRAGLEDGTYKAVPLTKNGAPNDHLGRSFMALLDALIKDGGVLWVDDRFTTSIDNAGFQTATTVEIIDALQRYNRLTGAPTFALRQRLRAARWMFMPLGAAEIVFYARAATRTGVLEETEDLSILRRAAGELLLHRRRLQWPDPNAVDHGARGEVPLLLDTGHAVSQALATIWNDGSWLVADAEAASAWIIDTLDPNLYPTQVIAAGDPRSDQLIGIHLGGLILVAIQIFSVSDVEERQRAYLDWLWSYVVANALRVRPEIRNGLEEMIESHLSPDDDGAIEGHRWVALGARMMNALPLPLRKTLLQRSGIQTIFGLTNHGQVSVDGLDFDELEVWHAVVTVDAASPMQIRAADGTTATLRWIDDPGDPHITMKIGRRTTRLDGWPRRVASDDPAIRREALDERRATMDLSATGLEAFNETLTAVSPASLRIRTVLARAHQAAQQFYADLENGLQERRSFTIPELMLDGVDKIARHLRLEEDFEQAAESLIADHGLPTAVRRLGGVPIAPPDALVRAIAALDDLALSHFLQEVSPETSPPWTQLFLADVLLARPLDENQTARAKGWIERALSDDVMILWDLYIALANYTLNEAYADNEWREMSARQQLASAWMHATAVTEALVGGRVRIDSLLEMLTRHRLTSPRTLVETLHKFDPDAADPQQMTVDRLRAHLAAPPLAEISTKEAHTDWAKGLLRTLIVRKTDDGERPRVEMIAGGLAPGDCLPSRLSARLSPLFADFDPPAGSLFRNQVEELLGELLKKEPGSQEVLAGWHLLCRASGDAPLPTELATVAREQGALLDLSFLGDALDSAREHLRAFTAIAANNGWTEQGARIDAAALTLGPRDNDEELVVLFEISIWRAKLITDLDERVKFLASELLRLSRHPQLREPSTIAARHYARYLSGHLASPFVEALGELMATE